MKNKIDKEDIKDILKDYVSSSTNKLGIEIKQIKNIDKCCEKIAEMLSDNIKVNIQEFSDKELIKELTYRDYFIKKKF